MNLRNSIVSFLPCIAALPAYATEPVIVSCKFEKLPLMILTYRGGMGADDNTLQVGNNSPVQLSVGSGLSSASFNGQQLVFSLRLPASVSITSPGSSGTSVTYYGECASTLGN